MRNSRLGPGKKSAERGSTFASRGGGLKRIAKKPKKPPPRVEYPNQYGWFSRVRARYGWRCIVCAKLAAHGHHVVPKRTIIARGGEEILALVYDDINGVPVCVPCHARHEGASRRIFRHELPKACIRWAVEHGWGWYIDDPRNYPHG